MIVMFLTGLARLAVGFARRPAGEQFQEVTGSVECGTRSFSLRRPRLGDEFSLLGLAAILGASCHLAG